jgi:hypothetical protein
MKSLREHHLDTRMAALQDNGSYKQDLIAIEYLANIKGWDYLCDKSTIFILSRNIYTA